jgi:hypothetical protein
MFPHPLFILEAKVIDCTYARIYNQLLFPFFKNPCGETQAPSQSSKNTKKSAGHLRVPTDFNGIPIESYGLPEIPGYRVTILVPAERSADLIVDDASLEEVFLFLQVDHFAHPWERIFGAGIELRQADLFATTVGDKV